MISELCLDIGYMCSNMIYVVMYVCMVTHFHRFMLLLQLAAQMISEAVPQEDGAEGTEDGNDDASRPPSPLDTGIDAHMCNDICIYSTYPLLALTWFNIRRIISCCL